MVTPIRLFIILMVSGMFTLQAQEEPAWSKEIPYARGKVNIYQPQYDSLSGDILYARTAIAILPDNEEPVFGAIWVSCLISTDRETRQISLEEILITDSRFPIEVEEKHRKALKDLLESEIPKWEFYTTIDLVIASLEDQQKVVDHVQYRNDPPEIIFSDRHSMLILFDGEPVFKQLENSKVQRAVNTPFLVFQDPD